MTPLKSHTVAIEYFVSHRLSKEPTYKIGRTQCKRIGILLSFMPIVSFDTLFDAFGKLREQRL
ncbi:MAG: hypothetical protein ACXV8U_23200, partial [Methylobacter sp.]